MRSDTLKTSIWIYFLFTSAGFIDCGGYRLRYQGTEGEGDGIPQIRASRYTDDANLKSSRSQLTLTKEQGYYTGSQIEEGKGIGNVMKEFLLQKDERGSDQSTIDTEQAQNTFENEKIVHQYNDTGKNDNTQNSNGKATFQINIKADLIEGKQVTGGVSELIDTAITKLKGLHGISKEGSESDHIVNGKIESEGNTGRSGRNEYALEEAAKLENVMQNNPKELIYDVSSKDASGTAGVSATYARQELSREQGRYFTDDQIGKSTRTELVDFHVNADSKNFEPGRYDNRKEVIANSGVNGGVNGEVRNLDNHHGTQTALTDPNYSIEADYSRRIKNTPHGGTEDAASRRVITTELRQVGQSDHERLSTEFDEDGNRRQKDTTKDYDLKIVIGDSSKSVHLVDQNPSLYRKEIISPTGTEYKTKDDSKFSNGDYSPFVLKDNDKKIISTGFASNTGINYESESIGIEAVEPHNNSFKKEIFETETQQQEKSPGRVTKPEGLILEKSEPYIPENRGYQNRQGILENLGNYKVKQIGSDMVRYNTGSSYNIDSINDNSKGVELENQDSVAIRKDLGYNMGMNVAIVEDSTLKDIRLQGLLNMNSQSEKGIAKQSETEEYIETGPEDEYPITYLTDDYNRQGRLSGHAYNTHTSESIRLREHDSTDLRKKEIEDSEQFTRVLAGSKPQFTDTHGHIPYDRNRPNLSTDLGNYGYTKKITKFSDEIEAPGRTDEAIHTETTANAMGSLGRNFVNNYSGQNRQTGNYYTIDVINNGENFPYRDSKEISQPVTAQIERDIRTKGVTRSDGTVIVDRKSESFLIDGLKEQGTSKVLEGGGDGGSTTLRREVTVTMSEPGQYYVNTGKEFTTDDIEDSSDRIELERPRSSYLRKENIEQDSVARNGDGQSYFTDSPNRQIVSNEYGSPSSTTFRKEVTVTTSGIGKTGDGINVGRTESQLTHNLGSHDIQTEPGYNIRGIGDSIGNVELEGDKSSSNLQSELGEISGNAHSMRVKENISRNPASQNIGSQSYFTGNPDRQGISSEYGSPSSTAFRKEATVTTSGIGQSRRMDDEFSRGRSRSQLTQNLGQDTQTKPGYSIREIGVSSESVELGGYRSSNLEKELDEISGNSRSTRVKEDISTNTGSQTYRIGNAERQQVSSGYENPGSTAFRKEVALTTSQIGQSSTRDDMVSRGIESQLTRTFGTHSEQSIPMGIGLSTGGLDRISESFDFDDRGPSALNTKDFTRSEIQADIGLDKVSKGYSSTQTRGPQNYFIDSQKEKSISNGFTDLSSTGFRKEVTVTISGNEQDTKSGSRPYESESSVLYKVNDYPGTSGSAFRREIGEIERDLKTTGGQVGGFQNSEWQKIPTSFPGQDSTAFRKDVKATSAVGQFSTPLDTKTANPPYQLPERNSDEVHSKGSSLTKLGLSTDIETKTTFQVDQKTDQNIRTGGGDITTQRRTLISRSEDNIREQEVGQGRTNQFDSNTYIENQGHNLRYSDSSAMRDRQSKINPGLYSDFGYNFRDLTSREFPRGYDNLHNNRQHGRNHYRNDDISDHYSSQNQGVSEIRRRIEYLSEPKPLTYTTVEYRNEPAFRDYSHPPLYGRIPQREHLLNINGRREDNTDLYVNEQFNKATSNTNSRQPGKKEISFDEHTGEQGHININIKENSSSIPKVVPSISFEGYGSSGITETNSNKNLYDAKDQSSNGHVDHSWSIDRNGRKVYKLPIPSFEIYSEP